ncbi:MAG: C40 family peptidase [Cytobacillus gottheilii]|uniref:C40 family peptidase n=1 Tax=Cytobacillus gottheilii TaxID=859144 RepID=UPI003464305C
MRQKFSKVILLVLIFSVLPFTTAFAQSSQEEIIKIAKAQLGVPYLYGGTTPRGFDCSGFVLYVFGKAGYDLPRTSSSQYHAGTKVAKKNLQPGDLVFFERTYSKAGITHAGIYIGNNEFISATSSSGIKIDSLSSSYWGPKYYGATRILADEGFSDVSEKDLAFEAIYALSDSEIIQGFEDGTFRPDQAVTRGQAAAIINRVLKKTPKNISAFKDVPKGSRFAKDIAAIKELGIINGFKDSTFRPDAYMTRAEMAVILEGAFKLNEMKIAEANTSSYSDITPAYWAHDAIVTMSSIDSTTIFDTDRYYATHRATRAFFTAAIFNSMNVKK